MPLKGDILARDIHRHIGTGVVLEARQHIPQRVVLVDEYVGIHQEQKLRLPRRERVNELVPRICFPAFSQIGHAARNRIRKGVPFFLLLEALGRDHWRPVVATVGYANDFAR